MLQQLNLNRAGSKENDLNLKPEEVMKEVERILIERDQVLLTGEKSSQEIGYSRKQGEAPETYLRRISWEISRQKESEKGSGESDQVQKRIEDAMEQAALYHELAKNTMNRNKSRSPSSGDSLDIEKILYIFTMVMVISIILYILFKV
jgi:preprotein translocase subunit SecF